MKRRIDILLAALLLALGAGCGVRVAEGGLDSPTDPAGTGALRGRALTSDGQPVAGARTIFIAADGSRLETKTAQDGTFSVDQVPSTHGTLVLNDGAGMGELRELTTYAHGTNELGDVFVSPLADHPRAVSLRDIGFEERITDQPRELLAPVFSSDGRALYAFRPSERRTYWRADYNLVKIDTATGEEALVRSWNPVVQQDQWPLLTLIDDRFLFYTNLYGSQPGGLPESIIAPTAPGSYAYSGETPPVAIFAQGSTLYTIVAKGDAAGSGLQYYVEDHYSGRSPAWIPFLPRADGSSLPMEGLVVIASEPGQLFFAPVIRCSYSGAQCTPGEKALEGKFAVFQLDLATQQTQQVGSGGDWDGLSRPWAVKVADRIYFLSDAHSPSLGWLMDLVELNLTTGERTVLTSIPKVEAVALVTDPSRRFAAMAVRNSDHHGSFFRITPGAATPLDLGPNADPIFSTDQSVPDGKTTPRFRGAELLDDGTARLWIAVCDPATLESDCPREVDDFDLNGKRLRRRPVALPQDPVDIVQPADRLVEALLLRDSGGQLQIAGARKEEPLSPRTFLHADHSQPAFSADGAWMSYVTRDPLSGFNQLFRVAAK